MGFHEHAHKPCSRALGARKPVKIERPLDHMKDVKDVKSMKTCPPRRGLDGRRGGSASVDEETSDGAVM